MEDLCLFLSSTLPTSVTAFSTSKSEKEIVFLTLTNSPNARDSTWVSHVTGTQALGTSSVPYQGALGESWTRSREWGLRAGALIWDTSIKGNSLATVPQDLPQILCLIT